MATATITKLDDIAGIAKIREAARNHHIGIKKYATQRLPKIEKAIKGSKAPGMKLWLKNYAKKLRLILAS